MTSLYADTLHYISDNRAFVCAFLTTTRPIFNSSIIPIVLDNNEDLWIRLVGGQVRELLLNFLKIFIYSDTFQFAPSLNFVCYDEPMDAILSLESMLNYLLTKTRYFSRTLKSIHFSNFELIPHISQIASLESIYVHNMDIFGGFGDLEPATAFGDQHLHELLISSTSKIVCLRHLGLPNIHNCEVSAAGFSSALLKYSSTLESLHLENCNIDDEILRDTISKLKALHTLNLEGNKKISDLGCVSLSKLENLTDLNIEGIGAITDKGILTLAGEEGDDELSLLPQSLCVLRFSSITSIDITGKAVEAIARNMINLQILDLSHVRRWARSAAASVSNLKNLEELYFYGCRSIDDAILHLFSVNLLRLRVLKLSFSTNLVTDAGFKKLITLKKTLQKLDLTHNSIGEAVIDFLKNEMPNTEVVV